MSSLFIINNVPPNDICLHVMLRLFNRLIKLFTSRFPCRLCGKIKRIFIRYFMETDLKEKRFSTDKRIIRQRQ